MKPAQPLPFVSRKTQALPIRAGQVVYDWMGQKDRCRLHWRSGKHAQKEEDWRALLDFSDECFFNRKGKSKFNQWVYPDFRPPLAWKAP